MNLAQTAGTLGGAEWLDDWSHVFHQLFEAFQFGAIDLFSCIEFYETLLKFCSEDAVDLGENNLVGDAVLAK